MKALTKAEQAQLKALDWRGRRAYIEYLLEATGAEKECFDGWIFYDIMNVLFVDAETHRVALHSALKLK